MHRHDHPAQSAAALRVRSGLGSATIAALALFAQAALAQPSGIAGRIAESDHDGSVPAAAGATAPEVDGPMSPSPRAEATTGRTLSIELAQSEEPAGDPASAEPEEEVGQDDAAPRTGPASIDLAAEEVPLSEILGLPARGPDGSGLGQVEDVVVSLRSGRMIVFVIGSGGLLGMGGETERVAIERISIDPLGGAVIVAPAEED